MKLNIFQKKINSGTLKLFTNIEVAKKLLGFLIQNLGLKKLT